MNRKLILLFFVLILASSLAIAGHVPYNGMKTPYPIGVYTEVAGLELDAIEIRACSLRNSYCVTALTNSDGYAQFDLGNFKVSDFGNNRYLPPFLPTDLIEVTACKGHESCVHTIEVLGPGQEGYIGMAKIMFVLTADTVEIEKIVETEKIIENTVVIKGDDVTVNKNGEDVTVSELSWMQKYYWWFLSFLALVSFWFGQDKVRGSKMFKTFCKKHRLNIYKKRSL